MITDRPVIDNKGNVSMIVGVASDSRPFKEQIQAFIGGCSSSMHVSTSLGPVSTVSPAAATFHSAASSLPGSAAAVVAAAHLGATASLGTAAATPNGFPSQTAAEDKAECQQVAAGLKQAAAGLKPLRWSSPDRLSSFSASQSQSGVVSAAPTNLLPLNLPGHWDGSSEGDADNQSRSPLRRFPSGIHGWESEEQAIYCFLGDGIITMWNAGSEKLFGYTEEEAMGRNIVELLCCKKTSHAAFQIIARLQEGQCWTGNFPLTKKSGEVFDAMITDRPIIDSKGNVSMIVGVATTPLESIPSPTAAEDKAGDKAEHWQLAQGLKPLQLNVTTAPLRPIRVPENATIFATGNETGGVPSRVARVASRLSAAPLRSPSHTSTTPLRLPALAYTDEADMTVPHAGLVGRGSGALGFQGEGDDGGETAAMAFDFPKGETAVPFDFSAEGGPGGGEAALPFEFDAEGEAAHAEEQHPWHIPFASTVLSLAGRVAQSIGQVRKRLSPTSSTVSSQTHLHLAEPMSPQHHLPLPPPVAAAAAAAEASISETRLGGGLQRRVVQWGRSPKASRLSPEGDRLSRHNSGSGSSCSSSTTAGAAAAGAGGWGGGGSDSANRVHGTGGPGADISKAHVSQFAPLQPETSPAAAAAADAAPAASPWHGFGFNSGIAGDAGAEGRAGVGAIVPSGARASAALAAAAAATACHAHMEDLILAESPKCAGGMGGTDGMGGASGMGGAGGMAGMGDMGMGDVSMGGQEQRDRLFDPPLRRLLERQQGDVSMREGEEEQRNALAQWQGLAQGIGDGQGSGGAGRELRVEREQGNRERQERERFWEDGVARWEIRWEDIQLGQEVGHGACGTVYHGTWNGSDVAVKVFARHDISGDFMRDFKKEIRIMEKLRHPNILLFMGAVASLDHLAIVTEFLPRGSLFRLLHLRTAGLTRLRLLRMALDVARGVNYLHKCSPPVVHHDLKSANLLVDRNWTVKVGDFGLSKMKFATYLSARSGRGTPQWMAPEVLRNEPSNEKSDVYSFGVVLWEMATRQVPWDGMNPMQVVGAVGFLEQQLPLPTSIDPVMRLLISDCWRSPNERPSFDEITSRLKLMVRECKGQK
ncbi:unnamed protein product [Closterium sp. NIES-64]|nr:unnamed protein product [Closterium sp. NIES-64]